MAKKLGIVALIIVFIVGTYLFLTSQMSTINSFIDIASNDTTITTGNYASDFTFYRHAVNWSRIIIYLIPAGLGFLAVIVTLREPEIISKAREYLRRG